MLDGWMGCRSAPSAIQEHGRWAIIPRPGDKRQFRCKSHPCRKKFFVTSGTLLHGRKKDFVTILIAVRLFISGAKGLSSIPLDGNGEMAIKTTWVLASNMRKAQIKTTLVGSCRISSGQ